MVNFVEIHHFSTNFSTTKHARYTIFPEKIFTKLNYMNHFYATIYEK